MRISFLIPLAVCVHTAWAQQDSEAQQKGEHQIFWEEHQAWESQQPEQPAMPYNSIRPLQKPAHLAGLRKEVFGYLPYWFRDRWNLLDYQLLSTIAYFSAEAGPDGMIGDIHGWPRFPGDPSANASVLNMINAAHGNGVRVVLCVTLFDANGIQTLVSNPAYRSTFIQQMISIVQAGNGDGINIDFEGLLAQSRDGITMLMTELADSFHVRIPGSQVSCAPTDYDTRSGDWNIAAINPSIDLFFFQGYGYGWSGSSTTRPVGLLPNTAFWGTLNETTLIDFVLARIPSDKVLLGVPHYGRIWPTATAEPKATTLGTGTAIYYPDALGYTSLYGRQWDDISLNPWFRYQNSAQTWLQGWYDDPESMSHKYQFILGRNLAGVGMWALGMDGSNHDIWDVTAHYFGDSTFVQPPRQPVLSIVKDTSTASEGRVLIRWVTTSQPDLGGFRLYRAPEPSMAAPLLVYGESTLGPSARSALVTGLRFDSTYYFRLEAIHVNGRTTSNPTDTYGVRTGAGLRFLVVDGFSRSTASYTLPFHSLSSAFTEPLAAARVWFDNAERDAVGHGDVPLGTYAGVFWFTGDNSTADRSLAPSHQQVLATYLEGGGKLFITGSEIGYDLDRSASPNYAPTWYANYLKASYVGDKATGSTYAGSAGSTFEGLSGDFGQVYPEDYPDYIAPDGGSTKVLEYNPAQIAGVAYAGLFGTGPLAGKLIYVGFAFETISSLSQRSAILEKTLDFFDATVSAAMRAQQLPEFRLEQNFPNPFNPTTVVRFQVPVVSDIRLVAYDILGREVAVLANEKKGPGRYEVVFDATGLASGVYLYRLTAGNFVQTRSMTLLR